MRRARRGAVALVLAALVPVLSGCVTARSTLGTNNGPCFVALPAAESAVHHQGDLVGVKLQSVSSLRRFRKLYDVAHTTTSSGGAVTQVCLVGFRGMFKRSAVEEGTGARHGTIAVVVLDYPKHDLLGTVLYRREPVRFGHSHVL